MVDFERGAILKFRLCCYFVLMGIILSWLSSGIPFVKQLYGIVNGNQPIYQVQKRLARHK